VFLYQQVFIHQKLRYDAFSGVVVIFYKYFDMAVNILSCLIILFILWHEENVKGWHWYVDMMAVAFSVRVCVDQMTMFSLLKSNYQCICKFRVYV
jgi:hypothetical protein